MLRLELEEVGDDDDGRAPRDCERERKIAEVELNNELSLDRDVEIDVGEVL